MFCDGRLIADRTAAAVLCDPALVEQAALKETSLYTLANRCGIAPAQEFVERFIEQDREVRGVAAKTVLNYLPGRASSIR